MALGPDRLDQLIKRHCAPDRGSRSGVPDLFLFARKNSTGDLLVPTFVEVKKPQEAISLDQRSEIAFLQSMGLRARVLTLMERKA